MHVFRLAKALAKPFMNIAIPEPLQKPDVLSSISIGMLDRICWPAEASLPSLFVTVSVTDVETSPRAVQFQRCDLLRTSYAALGPLGSTSQETCRAIQVFGPVRGGAISSSPAK